MEVISFEPRGKEYSFRLDKYSCYECKTGNCSLNDVSLEEIKNYEFSRSILGESNKEYCIRIAKLFLQGKRKDILTVSRCICGHYSLDGGQHRLCVAAHLLNKSYNIELNVIIRDDNTKCCYCGMNDEYNNMHEQIRIVDKIFKTKVFKDYIRKSSDFKEHIILRKL